MKKLLALVPLLAGGAWAGTTLVAGNQTEPAYNDLIAQLNQQSPVPFVVESYEKGLLSSTAITKVMESKAADAEVVLRLKHVMSHSTLAMDDAGARVGQSAIKTTLVLEEPMDKDLAEMLEGFNGADPFELISRVGVSGAADNTLILNPYKMEKDGASITAGGGEVTFTVGSDGSFKGGGSIEPVKATDLNKNQEVFTSEDITIAFDLERHEYGFYLGTQAYRVAKVAGIDPNTGQEFSMSDFALEADSGITGDTGRGMMSLSIGDLQSMLPINSGSLTATVDGLSVPAMAGFQDISNRLNNLPENDMEAVEAVMSDYAKLIADMFQGGSSIDYNLTLNNDGGAAVTDLNINRVVDAADFTNDTSLGELLMSLKGELTLDADGAAVDQTPMGFMLQAPPASDFISFDGSKYTSKVVLADNVIDLNGTPFPLDLIAGDMLQMSLGDALSFLQ